MAKFIIKKSGNRFVYGILAEEIIVTANSFSTYEEAFDYVTKRMVEGDQLIDLPNEEIETDD